MLHSIYTKGLGLFLLLVTAISSSATSLIPPQLKFRSILTSDIEKLAYINDIIQDDEGFLWFGAIQGLARYDGYKIKIYRHDADDPHSLTSSTIQALERTRDGSLWVLTNAGACKYLPDNDNFNCLQLPGIDKQHPPAYYSFYEDDNGHIWLSTSLGLKILDPHSRGLVDVPSALTEPLAPIRDSEANVVSDIVRDNDGRLWLGTYDNGLLRYDPATETVSRFTTEDGLGENKIRDLFIDSKGSLWIATLGGGLQQYSEANNDFTLIQHSSTEKKREVWSITEDKNGLFWIGDGTGVHLYDPVYKEFASYSYVEGLQDGPGNFVTRVIYHDNTDGTWVGYFPSGVDRIDRRASQFRNYRHDPTDPHSLADGGVLSTLEDEIGNLWVGCGFGLSYLDRVSRKMTTYKNEADNPHSLSGSTILDMDMDADGQMWIGAWDKGINRLDRESMRFTRYMEDASKPGTLFGREPWAVLVDSRNTLWVGTEKGLNRYLPQTDSFEKVMPKNAEGETAEQLYIREVYEDSTGMLWIGSFNGLYAFDPTQDAYVKHYRHDPANDQTISSDQVISVFEDRTGNIWVGTNGRGLNKIDLQTGEILHYLENDGLINLNVSGIVDDQAGHLWLSTYQGLVRLNTSNNTFTNFTKGDGPVGNLYNRNSPSRLRTGELVFGSTRGLTIFDPMKLDDESRTPRVAITDFAIFNESVSPGEDSVLKKSIIKAEHIDLNYDQSVFSFEFAALDYNSPGENRYSYRLLGFEDKWNNVGTQRHATYTNLDPGNYRLQVRAANNYGIWSEEAREITLRIHPPWWDTPLAWLSYLLIFVGGVFRMAYVYRNKLTFERQKLEQERAIVKQLKEIDRLKDQINRELDIKVEERTRELQSEHKRVVEAQRELKLLNSRLEEMSVTDQLTGLKNRRFLYQSIDADISLLARQWSDLRKVEKKQGELEGLTFAVLDIDHFKNINDKYGHTAGDSVLTQLSDVICENVRESDFVIRWGGEEFVVVLRHLPRSASFQIAQRIFNAIRSHKATLNRETIIDMRCSMGIVFFPFLALNPDALGWEQVLNIADQALYCAKHSGRDCWVSVEAPVSLENQQAFAKNLLKYGLTSDEVLPHLNIHSSCTKEKLVWFRKK